MKHTKVETRIQQIYNCSIVEFLQKCVDKKMDTHDIAREINCSVSNLRRIARKHQFTFYQPKPVSLLAHKKEFSLQSLNINNFLSRRWS